MKATKNGQTNINFTHPTWISFSLPNLLKEAESEEKMVEVCGSETGVLGVQFGGHLWEDANDLSWWEWWSQLSWSFVSI